VKKSVTKTTLNQFVLTTIRFLILTLENAATSDNLQSSEAWNNNGLVLTKLNKSDEVLKVFD
jgi:hypothetical protein